MKYDHEKKPEHGDKDHGHPDDKGYSIIVNGRERTVEDDELTFNQVVSLAFDDPPTGEFICFTITYRRGGGPQAGGHTGRGRIGEGPGRHDHQCHGH